MTAPIRSDGWISLPQVPTAPNRPSPAGAGGFADQLLQAIGDVESLQQNRDDLIAAFQRGDPVELHEVMAAAEEASLSLEVLVEIRNKLSDAYRTIMSVQV